MLDSRDESLTGFVQQSPPQEKYSVSRYVTEQARLFDLIDERLGNAAYLGGEKYSIADISAYPWFLMQRKMYPNNAMPHAWMDPEWPGHPNLARWFRAVSGRPAVKRSLEVLEKTKSSIGSATPDMVDRITGRGSYARG